MLKPLLAIVIAYIGSRAIFAAFEFNYAVFGEPFNFGKLIIDFGVFAIVFGGCYWLLGCVGRWKSKDAG
jgi:hypothetical protein